MEPHDSIRTEGRETLLGCQVMYEHIQVVTVAPQYGTVTVLVWICQDNTLAPTHRTCLTFHGLSVRRTAVSELGHFISSQLDHVHNGTTEQGLAPVTGIAGLGFQVCGDIDSDLRNPHCRRATGGVC